MAQLRDLFNSPDWPYDPDDYIAKREEFNNYTDSLCKSGDITPEQYETWTNPF